MKIVQRHFLLSLLVPVVCICAFLGGGTVVA